MSTRINRFIAQATGLSRRAADGAIAAGHVRLNGHVATVGDQVQPNDEVSLNGRPLYNRATRTVMLHKPVGYVCSRDGQGSKTIYDLLPGDLHDLKPVGRLDKDSSGLLLLTNDGQLANQLTHPSFHKDKVYHIELNKPLTIDDAQHIARGVMLDDGQSTLQLEGTGTQWRITMHEGRNRQIRRTFEQLGYSVKALHRTQFGDYQLKDLQPGAHQSVE